MYATLSLGYGLRGKLMKKLEGKPSPLWTHYVKWDFIRYKFIVDFTSFESAVEVSML